MEKMRPQMPPQDPRADTAEGLLACSLTQGPKGIQVILGRIIEIKLLNLCHLELDVPIKETVRLLSVLEMASLGWGDSIMLQKGVIFYLLILMEE